MTLRGYIPMEIGRYLDGLKDQKRLSAWQDDPEEMALRLNVVYFQGKAELSRARGDHDGAAYYEELVADRLELLDDEVAVAMAATNGTL